MSMTRHEQIRDNRIMDALERQARALELLVAMAFEVAEQGPEEERFSPRITKAMRRVYDRAAPTVDNEVKD